MTIARAQMYRQLYQMGGIGTLPMDYGQSLQVPQQPAPNFSSAQNITMNPLASYGEPQLGQAGGTPLMMRGGGMSRLGYQEGGMGMMQQQAPQMDAKQALELIIQMLIEQGIPPEQAREIAIQMVQAVAEGGMEEMSDERVEARFGGRIGYASGGIGSLVNREKYGFGSFISAPFKAAGKLVKGAVNAVKKVASSDIGKAALTVAAIYASGGGFSPEGFSLFGTSGSTAGGLLGAGGEFGLGQSYLGQTLLGTAGAAPTQGLFGAAGVFKPSVGSLIPTGISSLLPSSSTLTTLGLGTALGGVLGGAPRREDFGSDEEYEQAVAQWKTTLQSRLDQPNPQFQLGLFPNNPFYAQRKANGGRIGYGFGSLVSDTMVAQPVSNNLSANVRPLGLLFNPDGSYPTDSIKPSVGGSGFGGMISRLIQQNPDMFKQLSNPSQAPVAPSNGVADLIKQTTKQTYFGNVKPLYNYDLEDLYNLRRENNDYMYANGGRIGYAMGMEVPTRENQVGVKELDYRDTGGFVPPIGIKERADDIPAMLSNNEFVFTADAVRNAGGGNVNKGAERMYSLMKNLEAGGRV